MAEKALPITKRQYDAMAELIALQTQSSTRLGALADAVIMGQDESFPPANVRGVRITDGVHLLVLDLPDIAPPQIVQDAAEA